MVRIVNREDVNGIIDFAMKSNFPAKILMTADPIGGVWSYSIDLLEGFKKAGVEIVLVTMGVPLSKKQKQQVRVYDHITLIESEFRLEWMNNPWRDVEMAGQFLLEVAQEHQPVIVHLNGFVHAMLPWNLPVLVVAHSCLLSWWAAVKGTSYPKCYLKYREKIEAALGVADCVVAPSEAMLAVLKQHYDVEFSGKVILNGCDASCFSSRGRKQPVIFSAGRLWDDGKNVVLLDKIADQLEWSIILAGETKHPLTGSATLPKLRNVRMLGQLSKQAMASELRRAAIYAAPAFYEPFGLSVLEAALSGCALVLSDIPTYRELWGEAALFAAPDVPDAWVYQLNRLSRNKMFRKKLSNAARECALSYTRDRMVESYLETYSELMDSVSEEGKECISI